MADSHCSWNELATTDQAGALSFYDQLFGWTSDEAMPMGDYAFLDHQGQRIGAMTPYLVEGEIPIWTYYFRVTDTSRPRRQGSKRASAGSCMARTQCLAAIISSSVPIPRA